MAQNNDNDHPYPFMLPSTSMQNSALNRASPVRGLESHMESLTLDNPYVDDFTLHRMRITGAANAATPHVYQLYPNGSFIHTPSYEQLVWSRPVSHHHNLEPHRGRWLSMAMDPRGCRSLQKKIDSATPQEICKIVKELRGHLHHLIKHDFGHFVIQKLFQSTNVSVHQTNAIIYLIVTDVEKLKDVCMHEQGYRVFQMLLEYIESPYMIQIITDAVRCITVALMKNFNGGYVIQHCLKLFPLGNKNAILDVVVKNFLEIARDKCGCSIVQRCIGYAESETTEAFLRLVNEIIINAVVLSEHPYGNYVVQFLVKRRILWINAILISRLRNTFIELSMNKYASNVVENLLEFSETEDAAIIVQELMASPEFLYVIQNPYGNYVVKKALQNTQGFLHLSLCTIILSKHEHLNGCLYGRLVLAFVRSCRCRGSQKNV